jgi:hypothetical protein
MNAGPAIALIVVSSCRIILSLRLKARFECKRCQIGLIGSYRSGRTSGDPIAARSKTGRQRHWTANPATGIRRPLAINPI